METCQWLLNHPDYLNWLDPKQAVEHHGFLWIKGKPGAGKSTIMNFAFEEATKDKTVKVISFFFNARGDILERSILGMYRSLLFQLLNTLPGLLEVFDGPRFKHTLDDLHETITNQSRHHEWQVETLQGLLQDAIARIGQQPLKIFIDALDECDVDEVEEMLEYLGDIGQCAVSAGTKLHVCFSSRHYPHIDINYGRKLVLEAQEGHEMDIVIYIKGKLKVGRSKLAEEIRAKMQEKAKGIFIWVVLVAEILNEEYKRRRIFDVKKRLDLIPTKLSDLFKEILWRDQKNIQDLQLCIQWILYSKRPLKLEEYYFAAVSGLSPGELRDWDPEDVTRDDMGRFVLSSSKGLVEVAKSKNPTVQFIHESVREFFLKDGVSVLWPNLTTDFPSLSHGQLNKCCQAYLELDVSAYLPIGTELPNAKSGKAKSLRNLVSSKFPFLEYATRHILYHADAAAKTFPHEDFLRHFNLNTWIHLDNLFQIYNNRRHTSTASLLYIVAENNLAKLIGAALCLDPRIDIEGERHQYPFFAALANGHEEAVKALLQIDASYPQDECFSKLARQERFRARKSQTPISWAAEQGYTTLVELFLDEKRADVDVNLRDYHGRTPLSFAAEGGHTAVVEILLDKAGSAIDLNLRDRYGLTPLLYAAERGHEAVITTLFDKASTTVDVNLRDNYDRTPLSLAAERGHEATVKLLLAQDGVDVNSKDVRGRTSLVWATLKGHEATVKLLLAQDGVDVNAKDKNHWTLLSWAAITGYEAIVQILLVQDGIDVDSKDDRGRTSLLLAVMTYAEVNPGSNKESWISADFSQNVRLKLLFSDQKEQKSVIMANKNITKHEAVIKLLLDSGKADIHAQDENGETPFLWATKLKDSIITGLFQSRE